MKIISLDTPPLARAAMSLDRSLLATGLLASTLSMAQAPGSFDAPARRQVIDNIVLAMHERYVFPEMAPKLEAALREPAQARALMAIDDPKAFAARLTEALQALTRDKHLRVMHSDTLVPEPRDDRPADADIAQFRSEALWRNFGVERVERLPGNIGYIDLRGFANAEWAGDAIAAAMTLTANTQALIVDLRKNGGGDPSTVALMSSYLLDERTHLNDLYDRPGNRTTQYWSLDWVPGKRFGGSKPVYVLISKNTFSGAEEFSYNLKNLKRATLVGETTGGGAHPGELRKLGPYFRMFVATGRAISPITKTNWEGVGVEPDIKVPADDALRVAQLRALAPMAEKATDPALRRALQARIAELEKAR
jgi:retinol-binding protein 3